ncbi:MAG: sigma-70 family RNA polymerase sigma factor [Bacteroidaceae bacterium]|nr:sigma-70 family RNA polymerase sigma factor [Bacteroidaceae bacterium]
MTEKEFAEIMKKYSEPLYWQIRRMVNNHEDANDLLQNTFMKAWTNADSFRNDSKISTWLYRIATNETLDFLRKQKRSGDEISMDEVASIANRLNADKYFDGDEIQTKLQTAITTLPPTQRTVFNMRYFDDMKYSDMSKILGTSEGALKASYHLAVQKISNFFSKHD